MKRAIIFVNGNLSDTSEAKNIITDNDCLIASDGGVKHVLKLGLVPQIIIGDFDSISRSLQKKLKNKKIEQIKYSVKKDKSDFELAIDLCLKRKFQEIIIIGILGDRIDHMIANIFLIAKIQTQNPKIKIKIFEGKNEIFILNNEIIITGKIGDEISIIPVSDKLEGIITEGLEYRLKNEELMFGSTRGISNVMKKTSIKILIKKGVALVEHNF